MTKSKAKRVLVVEDDKDLREHMVRIFELGGYDTSGAENGAAALQTLALQSVDLVITDVIMPQMDGFQLASKLAERFPTLPVIVMSGTRAHSAESCAPGRANIRKFLLKPVSLDVLINSVLEII